LRVCRRVLSFDYFEITGRIRDDRSRDRSTKSFRKLFRNPEFELLRLSRDSAEIRSLSRLSPII
jgi:hypothetical protein